MSSRFAPVRVQRVPRSLKRRQRTMVDVFLDSAGAMDGDQAGLGREVGPEAIGPVEAVEIGLDIREQIGDAMRVPQLLHLGGAEQRAVALAPFESGAEPAEEPVLPGECGVEGAAGVKR